ncbi:MAG: hypothetical protein MRZ79_02060 [Bacteroidia bacterium]|nr:hypothetical protein [Bacteroidia bacterium]
MKLPQQILNLTGIALMVFGGFMALNNYSPGYSEEAFEKDEFFCENKKEVMGSLSDTLTVFQFKQNSSESYNYFYEVDGNTYQVQNVSFASREGQSGPPREYKIYYLESEPANGTIIDPCVTLTNRRRKQDNMWKFYLGIACLVVGFMVRALSRGIKQG